MHYLARTGEDGRLTRERVCVPFPWARSALVCFASYLYPAAPLSTKTPKRGSAWIARYAWSSRKDEKGERRPSDYHKVLLKRLRDVEARLHAELGEFESRCYVDTGPVVERSLAVAAGLGWAGKNTCLIHPELGSWGFLAVLLTSLEVREGAREQGSEGARTAESAIAKPSQVSKGHDFSRADETPKNSGALAPEGNSFEIPARCGTCRRCIEACPTHALDVPYQMDATRCISYLTIEHKGPIAEELMPGIGRQVFGCDICQDVCPWNGKALRNGPIVVDRELEPRPELINPTLDWLAALDEKSFEREFNGSPVRRAGFLGLRRNVAIAMGNSGLAQYAAKLEEWAAASDEGLRAAAQWALAKLRT
jgi:epoxyqueuosine reductase